MCIDTRITSQFLFDLVIKLCTKETSLFCAGTQEQCRIALGHIERFIQKCHEMLNKQTPDRKKPK